MVATHLVLVLSDLPVKVEGRGETLAADLVGRWVDTGVRLCPDSCCIGAILLRSASQEREGSMKEGGGEDSVGRREEEAGNWVGGVWIGGKGGKMKLLPCRGRGGEEGDFGAEMSVQDGDLLSTGDLSPD